MSDERSKISLRSGGKRKGRPTISAPRQISNPILQDGANSRAPASRPAPEETPRSRPRPPPQSSGKVSYSQPPIAEAVADQQSCKRRPQTW